MNNHEKMGMSLYVFVYFVNHNLFHRVIVPCTPTELSFFTLRHLYAIYSYSQAGSKSFN